MGTTSTQRLDTLCRQADKLPGKPFDSGILPCQNGRNRCKPCASKGHDDPYVHVLCEIFCKILCEGDESKSKKGAGSKERFNYSQRARELGNEYVSQGKLPDTFKMEKRYLVPFDKKNKTQAQIIERLKKTGRKAWSPHQVLSRITKEIAGKAAVRTLKRKANKLWMKLVPGLNVLSTAMDIIDIAAMAAEVTTAIKKEFTRLDPSRYDTFESIPDVAREGPNGKIESIYDWKFPGDSLSEDQDELYKQLSDGNETTVINQKRCDCGCEARPTPVS